MKLTPTKEQENVLELAMEGYDIRINAFAGASKTTTLSMIANEKHEAGGERGLYLAFNKVTAVEAQGRFPNSVECKTVHSLAYRATPKDIIAKLGNTKIFPKDLGILYKFNGSFITNDDGNQKYISVGAKVSLMNQAVERFCNSADDKLTEKHLVKAEWMSTPIGLSYDLNPIMQEVLELAQKHWENIIDPKSPVPLTHSAYLKLYSMSNRPINTDYIMIDENQDSSPVILKIVDAQKKAQKIYVGDRYQAIYGWRGAINAMDIVSGTEVFLTKSFRFGNNVEMLANILLDFAGNENPLRGNGSDEGKILINGLPRHPDVVICRTNAGVIQNIFDYNDRHPELVVGASCDLKEIEKFVYAYSNLCEGKKVEHPLLFAFDNVGELRQYCEENTEDLEITGMVKLIDKFSPKGLIAAIKKCESAKKVDIMVTTAHKSKGLEWNDVYIYSDFFYDVRDEDGLIEIHPEELNLIYVACTRAKRHIDIAGINDLFYHMLMLKGDQETLAKLGFSDTREEEEAKADIYGNDDVARATGGVCVSTKLGMFSAQDPVVQRKIEDFFQASFDGEHRAEAFESWLQSDEGGSFEGKILGAGGVLLDDFKDASVGGLIEEGHYRTL